MLEIYTKMIDLFKAEYGARAFGRRNAMQVTIWKDGKCYQISITEKRFGHA